MTEYRFSKYHLDIGNDHKTNRDPRSKHDNQESAAMAAPTTVGISCLVSHSPNRVGAGEDEGWERKQKEIDWQSSHERHSILKEMGQ